uniref:Uncharacterized protein n=1 Tax=Rhinopithecus bieti TaxID=61621 RepID=A0A2K6MIT6_RHIBE
MDVGFQGRCSRWFRALRERYSSAERKRRQAPRVSAPPGRLPAVFPQFALLPQSGPRLIICTCEWAHTQVLRTRSFHLGAGRGVSHLPVLKSFVFFGFLTNKWGGMLAWPPAAPARALGSLSSLMPTFRRSPALLTPGLLRPLAEVCSPMDAGRGLSLGPKDVPLQ